MLFYEHGPGRIQALMYQLPESCSHAVMEIAVAFVQSVVLRVDTQMSFNMG